MPKLNPYLIENKKPFEIVQEIENYQIKKTSLSPAARGKVINKSGSNYVSENKDYYGPGNSESSSSNFSPAGLGACGSNDPIARFERRQRERRRDEELNRAVLFVAETAVKATAVSALTVATGNLAPAIGGGA
jgi:hypothetical protein